MLSSNMIRMVVLDLRTRGRDLCTRAVPPRPSQIVATPGAICRPEHMSHLGCHGESLTEVTEVAIVKRLYCREATQGNESTRVIINILSRLVSQSTGVLI